MMMPCSAGFGIETGLCMPCLPGSFSPGGSAVCIQAPIGFYVPEAQASTFLPCEFSQFAGASTCSIDVAYHEQHYLSKAGYFSPPETPGMQYICSFGYYALPQSSECTSCSDGEFDGFATNERLCSDFKTLISEKKERLLSQISPHATAESGDPLDLQNVQYCDTYTGDPYDFGNKMWQNTCKIRACFNKTVVLTTCPSLGGICNVQKTNAYFYALDSSSRVVGFSQDYCGVCPHVEFTREEPGCDYYYLKQGCLLGCTVGVAVYNADVTPDAPELVMGSNTSQSERDVLIDFYHSTGGPNWYPNAQTNWLSSEPVNTWAGVMTNTAGNVLILALPFAGMNGVIPPSFATLQHLVGLGLYGNGLDGSIALLEDMESLAVYEIGDNLFTGRAPLTHPSNSVIYYAIGQSYLTGTVPRIVDTSLREVILFRNYFTGTIPATIGEDMPSLVVWNFPSNLISGSIPNSVGLIKHLRIVYLQGNMLTGTIPPAMGDSEVIVLTLNDNSLVGSLPSSFSFSTALTSLILSSNSLFGHLPDLSSSTLLVAQFDNNQFDGSIPASFGSMSRMTYLSMSNNNLEGTLPPSLGELPFLYILDVSQNALAGTIPSTFGSTTTLLQLFVNNNSFTGSIPTSLCEATALSNLYVGGNSLCYPACLNVPLQDYTDSYEHCWGDSDVALCKTASALNLYSVMQVLKVAQPTIVLESPHPRTVNSPSNVPLSFTVHVDDAFEYAVSFDCRSVTLGVNIDICTNSSCAVMMGHFRASVYGLTPLPGCAGLPTLVVKQKTFFVKDYGVVAPGSPTYTTTTFGFLINIVPYKHGTGWLCDDKVVDEGRRQLSAGQPASLPTTVKYASNYCRWYGITCNYGASILSLSLPALGLKGYIPTELSALSSMTTLVLSYNSITGTIPTELGIMRNLQDLQMVSNRLVGGIPTSICELPVLTTLSLSSNFLSGSLPEYLNDLKSITTLLLGSNQFSGKVPNSLCALAHRSDGVSIDLTQNPFACFESCWSNATTTSFDEALDVCAPTAQPTEAPFSHQEKLSDGGIAGIVIACVVVVFVVALLVWHSFYLQHEKKYSHLPIHFAAITGKDISDVLLDSSIDTACMTDHTDQTAVMLIFHHHRDVPVETIVRIVLAGLSPECVLSDAPERYRDWWFLVQQEDSKSRAVVLQVLSACSDRADELAECMDLKGRRCVDIAEPYCKEAINRYRYLHQRYELQPGPPQHKSATSLVIFAVDHGEWDVSENLCRSQSSDDSRLRKADEMKSPVALKFMTTKSQFDNELAMRSGKDLSSAYVIGILESYGNFVDSIDYRRFYASASSRGFGAYPYCLVMPEADSSLKSYVDRQHIVGDWDEIRRLFKQVVTAVGHLHSRNIIHGDLKPMNVVMVGTSVRLIDLDAAVSCDPLSPNFAGRKFSSAYLPPELLGQDDTGKIVVKSPPENMSDLVAAKTMDIDLGYQLVRASPSLDMWALGCLLYLLCSGMTLFRATVEDNIGYEPELLELYEWTSFNKEERLSSVTNRLARNLLALLLNKDPSKRLDVSHVLSHPFLTGKSFSNRRLQGERPTYDVFLSYRVDSDSEHVELLHDKLVNMGLKVWWDRKCLLPGQPWEEGFCDGLVNSSCFVCLVSEGAINHPSKAWQNFSLLEAGSRCDNVLLEWRLAEELRSRDMLDGIFPVMIGRHSAETNTYSNYFSSGCHPSSLPAVVVASVEHKLSDHLDRQNLGVPFLEHCTVQSVVTDIMSNQGGFVAGNGDAAWTSVATTIRNMADIISQENKAAAAASTLKTSKSFFSRTAPDTAAPAAAAPSSASSATAAAQGRVADVEDLSSNMKASVEFIKSALQVCKTLIEDGDSQLGKLNQQMLEAVGAFD